MASYGGRRGPNVSQYLRHLNTIPAESTQEETFIDEDIDLFTNTQFFDFESGQTTDFQPPPVKPDAEQVSRSATDDTPVGDLDGLDFISDFNFPEYPPYQSSSLSGNYPDGVSLHPLPPTAPVYSAAVPQQQHQQQSQQHAPFPQHQQAAGEKSEVDSIAAAPAGQFNYEEVSRVAAEEDKRKRNTAASARFRVKKKQREQALERNAKEMSDKVTVLEGRIQQLETENKWLKNMILEKNSGGDQKSSSKEGKEGLKEASEPSKP